MREEVKIIEFLRTGRFGRVALNDSFPRVKEILGEPDGEHNPEVVRPRKGIHYSRYEFMFLNDRLESIQNDHYDPKYPNNMEFENEGVVFNSAFLKADKVKTLEEVAQELERVNIAFNVIDYWNRKALKTMGNVVIDFNDEKWSDTEEDWVYIENMQYFELIGIRMYE